MYRSNYILEQRVKQKEEMAADYSKCDDVLPAKGKSSMARSKILLNDYSIIEMVKLMN